MTLEIFQTNDLTECHRLRRVVFIEEQGVSEAEELDDQDSAALHFLATLDGIAIGTARVLFAEDMAKIGRVCVAQSHRDQGIGGQIMTAILDQLRARPGLVGARLGAQLRAIPFYERLGFQARGPVFLDAGIEHRDMVLVFE
jgi:ElaA protein